MGGVGRVGAVGKPLVPLPPEGPAVKFAHVVEKPRQSQVQPIPNHVPKSIPTLNRAV